MLKEKLYEGEDEIYANMFLCLISHQQLLVQPDNYCFPACKRTDQPYSSIFERKRLVAQTLMIFNHL